VSEGIVFFIDKTDQEKMNNKIREIQKMKSIGNLAGGVAHDFNNMLSIIFGNVQLAMNLTEKNTKVYEYLQQIEKAAHHSAQVTKQLLGFARKQNISPKVIDIVKSIKDMIELLKRIIGENIELKFIPSDDACYVFIDPMQLNQIIFNVCANGRDAITNSGTIVIETMITTISDKYCSTNPEAKSGKYAILLISDNGCGIDKDNLAYIFDPFSTTKEIDKGSGLGLATVYGIVKQNNGFINVYSELNKGTTFKIYLPLSDRHTDEVVDNKQNQAEWLKGKETILLVEDDPSILEMLKDFLNILGYKVITADTPLNAIQKVKDYHENIDLMIIDIIMPQMNGKELSDKICEIKPNIKKLFMSGHSSNVISHRGIIDEGCNFIEKPFSIDTLSAKIRDVLKT